MPKHFVLLKLDNPRDKSKQTPEEIEQYKELSQQYKITGVPSILLVDTEGAVFSEPLVMAVRRPRFGWKIWWLRLPFLAH